MKKSMLVVLVVLSLVLFSLNYKAFAIGWWGGIRLYLPMIIR